jgi:hypothetical protein
MRRSSPVMCKPKPPRQSAYPSGASRCRYQGKTHGVTIPGIKMPVPRVTASCGQQTPMRNPEATSHYINAARSGTPSMSHVEGSGRIWVRLTMLPEVPPLPIRARQLSQIHGGGWAWSEEKRERRALHAATVLHSSSTESPSKLSPISLPSC